MIEICTVGGYDEVGKNMTAVRVGNEVVILDMGFQLENLISYEDEQPQKFPAKKLINIDAIPNDELIKDWRSFVVAIIPSHGHLDHIGAIPYLCEKYGCPIIATPYTIELMKSIMFDNQMKVSNQIRPLLPNSRMKISENFEIEFISITHSTLQAVMIALHTPHGIILYANDFKFDSNPIIGKKPDFARLKRLSKEDVRVLIVDSIYAYNDNKTPSEKVAREMLKDVMLGTDNVDSLIIATTFASHIARVKSIVDFGQRLGRKVVLVGRSMNRYVNAAKKAKLVNFENVKIVPYSSKVKQELKKINDSEKRNEYLIICTGNQGEPNSILSKIARKELPLELKPNDHVIFSCKTIPSPINQANREQLDKLLKNSNVRIFKDLHVSGHASKEDLRDLISMVKPEHIIPAHVDNAKAAFMAELASEMGFILGENVHIMKNGLRMRFE
ncbi:RNase J family beta-CASP ribonuclease [Candidatus Woesearchaeota archaeon]|nr:RNase J family beta-CASP ribonuclease [Candidatus Woesearchaeota archaeon]